MPTPSFDGARMLIDGDRFRMESLEATYEGIFNIDVEEDPPHIDIEFIEGPEAGNWSYGIYTLDKLGKPDKCELTICLGLTGSPRPQRFATSPGSGHGLERLRRVSAARPAGVTGGKRPAASAANPAASALPIDESIFALPMTPLLERLQGEWLPVSLVTSGKPLARAMLGYGGRTQVGNETKVVFGGQTMVHALMRLNASTSPIEIDYLNIGKGARTVSLGILDWMGDEVRISMASAGAPRPADFSCDAGSGRTLSQWKRK